MDQAVRGVLQGACGDRGRGGRRSDSSRERLAASAGVRGQIVVRDGKGAKDRVTVLPLGVREAWQAHLHRVRELHEKDLAAGFGARRFIRT